MDQFPIKKALQNPKFDGYKLDAVDQDDYVSRCVLPEEHRLSQAISSGTGSSDLGPLSFKEVQSRISHNHLVVCPGSSNVVWVNKNGGVVSADLRISPPTFRTIYQLPHSVHTSLAEQQCHREYPSASFLSTDTLFLSDGEGLLYVLSFSPISAGTDAKLLGTYKLPQKHLVDAGGLLVPFRVHSAHLVLNSGKESAVVILSSRNYDQPVRATTNKTKNSGGPGTIEKTSKRVKGSAIEFDIWAAQFDVEQLLESSLTSTSAAESIQDLDILWHRRGDSVPSVTSFDSSRKAFVIIGGSLYRTMDAQGPPTYEPTPDEYVPIPRSGDAPMVEVHGVDKPPPYSWTQTSDSVTIVIPLPASTKKTDIEAFFTARTLTIQINAATSDNVLPVVSFDKKELWDGISSSSSYWTWDKEGEKRFGLLTLYLDKQHEGTRWMQIFASSDDSETQVLETLDPSELYQIRESLEKYSKALETGEDASGLGLGTGVPRMAEGELDEEVDADFGSKSYVTWICEGGSQPPWMRTGGREAGFPFQFLAASLPGSDKELSIVIKDNLDGAVFTIPPASLAELSRSTTVIPPRWEHQANYFALAFVLASKRDVRFTLHIPSGAVYAFENGLRDRGGNVYIYRPCSPMEKWSKQAILKVGGGNGALLGVGAIRLEDNSVNIVSLMEGEIAFIKYT